MPNQQIKEEQIRSALKEAGWSRQQIDQAFATLKKSASEEIFQLSSMPSIGNLLRRTWQIYKKRIKVLLGIEIIPILVSVPLIIALTIGMTPLPGDIWFIPLLLFYIFYVLVVIILQLWATIALVYAIKKGGRIGIKDSFKKAWSKVLPYLWIFFLIGFITFGGSILFIIPGVIFSVWFSLALYVLISEDLRGTNALFRSKQLVRGNWWGVLWRFVAMNSIIIIITLPISIFLAISVTTSKSLMLSSLLLSLDNFYQLIISLFFVPFVITYSYLIYKDLKKLKQAIPFMAPKKNTKNKFILIGIAGFLVLGLVMAFSWFLENRLEAKVRDAKRETDLMMIQNSLGFYYSVNNRYPYTLQEIGSYIGSIPRDPKTILPYAFRAISQGEDYELCIDFETKEDGCVYSPVKPKVYNTRSIVQKITRQEVWEIMKQAWEKDNKRVYLGGIVDDLDFDGQVERINFSFYVTPKLDDNKTIMHLLNTAPLELDGTFEEAFVKDIDGDGKKEVIVELDVGVNDIWTEIYSFKNEKLEIIPTEPKYESSGLNGRIKFVDNDGDRDLEIRIDHFAYPPDPCKRTADIYEYTDEKLIKVEEIKVFDPNCRGLIEELKDRL